MLSRQCVRNASTAARAVPEMVTKSASGLTIASKDDQGPISQLVLAFRAGSRFEESSQKGAAHVLKNFVGRDSNSYHGVQLTWSSQTLGATVKAFATRDLYGVHMSVPRDQTSVALSILGNMAASPSLKPWELEEIHPTFATDAANQLPFDHVFEGIHAAAFRNGSLARSVNGNGKVSVTQLQNFADRHLRTGQAILYGLNIEHDRLVSYGENHAPIEQGPAVSVSSSPYKGGESRIEGPGSLAHIILAGEGASATNAKALATQAVLLEVLGQGPSTKFSGSNGNGILANAAGESAGATAISAAYDGAGLVGAYLVVPAGNVAYAVKNVVSALKQLSVKDVSGPKTRARMNMLRANAHSAEFALERAAQTAAGVADGAVVKAIESVTAEDLNAAAAKLASNLSIASYGAIENVPYRDEL